MMADASAFRIAVAALGGAAIGVERQWSGHATGAQARFGGVRTFTLLGGVAGMAGWLATQQLIGISIALTAGAAALVVAGYVAASRHGVDATTETAGLVVIGAGFAAGLGWIALASGVVAVSTLLLVEKSDLHALVGRINNEELRAASLFGVMAIVILPLLPEGPLTQLGGIKPRELWLLVLLFSGFSFTGYLARRMFGADRGYQVTGLLAGIVSSTSATFTFARQSRTDQGLARPLAIGAIGACTMLFPRVLAALLVLNVDVAVAILPYVAPPLIIGVATLLFRWRSNPAGSGSGELSNPLQIVPALQMAVTFQLVLTGVEWAHRQFGSGGLLASGAVLGLTDVDALTISMARSVFQGVTPHIAAQAIAIGVFVNCVLKAVLAVALGARPFRKLVGATVGAMAVVMAISLVLLAMR
jgi:uncharacterized membrane protein (DUF4010 family)